MREDYTGHEKDATGLHYAGARYYMSAFGRWNATDPVADSYPGYSPYNYVLNNPINLYDLTGLCPEGVGSGEYFYNGEGELTLCYSAEGVTVTAERPENSNGPTFTFGSTRYVRQPSNSEEQAALTDHFTNHPNQAMRVLSSDDFSEETKKAAFIGQYRANMQQAMQIALQQGGNLAFVVSVLASGGTIYYAGRGILVGARGAIGSVSNLSRIGFYASGAETAFRAAAVPVGGSKADVVGAALGFGVSALPSVSFVRGVNPAPLSRGAAFRSASTGRFVSNSYGFSRFGAVHGLGAVPPFVVLGSQAIEE